jgi:hypothetical protein
MRAFIAAVIATFVVAAVAAVGLQAVQKPVDVAFATSSTRVDPGG